MNLFLLILTGLLFGLGAFLLLRRSVVKLLLGVLCLGHAVNLLIFIAAGVVPGIPPMIPATQTELAPPHADALPQALILTSIVISFGVQSLVILLIYRIYRSFGIEDVESLSE